MTSFIVKQKWSNSILVLGVYTTTEKFFYQDFKSNLLRRLDKFSSSCNRAFDDFERDDSVFARSTSLESRLIVSGLTIDFGSAKSTINLEKVEVL